MISLENGGLQRNREMGIFGVKWNGIAYMGFEVIFNRKEADELSQQVYCCRLVS
jgi:hypothetical protein